jgi:hypothetical protein
LIFQILFLWSVPRTVPWLFDKTWGSRRKEFSAEIQCILNTHLASIPLNIAAMKNKVSQLLTQAGPNGRYRCSGKLMTTDSTGL